MNQQTQLRFCRGYYGCIQCHFHEKNVIFIQHIFDKTNCGYPSSLDVPQFFVVLHFIDFYLFNKLQMYLETMSEINIQTL
jgi:hypothetical protein